MTEPARQMQSSINDRRCGANDSFVRVSGGRRKREPNGTVHDSKVVWDITWRRTVIAKYPLGRNGRSVGRLGYGAMVLEGYYGAADDNEGVRPMHHALDVGLTMSDSADAYGNGHNELLVGRALRDRRSVRRHEVRHRTRRKSRGGKCQPAGDFHSSMAGPRT